MNYLICILILASLDMVVFARLFLATMKTEVKNKEKPEYYILETVGGKEQLDSDLQRAGEDYIDWNCLLRKNCWYHNPKRMNQIINTLMDQQPTEEPDRSTQGKGQGWR